MLLLITNWNAHFSGYILNMSLPVISSDLSRLQRRLDFRRLHYFMQIVDAGSLSSAAVALRVAQPALTKAVRSLESDLDLTLLKRSPRGVKPTAAGSRLYVHCKTLFSQLEVAYLDLKREEELQTVVRLGLPYSVGAVMAAPLLEAAVEQTPNISLEMTEKHTPELVGLVAAGKLDLALISTTDRFPELEYKDLVSEEIFLVAPFNRHAADLRLGIGRPIELNQLQHAPIILPTPSLHLRILIEQKLKQAGANLQNVREIDVFSMILNCLDAGLGYSILPAGWIHREVASKRLRAASFRDRYLMSRVISLCWARRDDSPDVTGALKLIERVAAGLIDSGGWMSASMIDK
ncbi:LysR family transcriptional regulator [Aquibaculum arenosum]|uniref:LysR substrate-binding domain-containing protein n=1 Tax=Aquibaculum arenosum TaxID=3032591 RepID=A0ABT5YQV2_9PROT|nr:LysR substrate-binding domain-containing protein [Fodinicurvata sp. CAU 1616]MDF2097339.1 LysR substrate-binding domain-containing protein [Fodinicurvata sp. CAU 1616]